MSEANQDKPDFCPYCGRVLSDDIDGVDDVAGEKVFCDVTGEITCVSCCMDLREKEEEKRKAEDPTPEHFPPEELIREREERIEDFKEANPGVDDPEKLAGEEVEEEK